MGVVCSRFHAAHRHGFATRGVRVDEVGVNPPRRAVVAVGAESVTERRAAPDLGKLGWQRPHGRGSPTSGGMPPCKRRSLGDPRVCSRIISIAEVDRRHAARKPRRIAGKRADLARTACASTHVGSCAPAAKRRVAVAVLEPAPGLSRSRCEGLIDGRCLGLFNRAELALCERKGPSVLQVGAPSWRAAGGATGDTSGMLDRLAQRPTSLHGSLAARSAAQLG
jgi:hypothetical protein